MNETVIKFGNFTTNQINRHPVRGRKILAAVFKGYGLLTRLKGNEDDLPARNYEMWMCNEAMAQPLNHPGNTVIVSIFTPCEVFHAMGLKVVFPEGLGCYMTASACEKVFLEKAEECGVPETLCSYHKMLIGMAETGVLPKPLCIVNTTMACDANQLSFRYLADYFDVPHLVLDVPTGCDRTNVNYLATQLKDMTNFIEECSGRWLDPEKFEKCLNTANRSIENYHRILELKATRHETTKITYHMMDIFALHVLLGTEEVEKFTEMMIKDLEGLPEETPGVRILWVHTIPYWQDSMIDIFNYNDDVEVVSCDMCFDNLSEIETDRPYDSLAKQILRNTFNGSADRRIEKATEYAKKLNVDGIIYFCHWGCKQTLGACSLAKGRFEASGVPTLTLDGDGCDTRNIQDGQMVTRVCAFLEQLEATK